MTGPKRQRKKDLKNFAASQQSVFRAAAVLKFRMEYRRSVNSRGRHQNSALFA